MDRYPLQASESFEWSTLMSSRILFAIHGNQLNALKALLTIRNYLSPLCKPSPLPPLSLSLATK